MKTFTLFWLTGDSEVVKGTNFPQAMTLAGYSNGAIPALDFYDNGDVRLNYEWDAQNHRWSKKLNGDCEPYLKRAHPKPEDMGERATLEDADLSLY